MPSVVEIPKIPAGAIKNHLNLPVKITNKGVSLYPPSRESIENADVQNVPLSIQQDKFIFTLIANPVHHSRAWKAYQVAYPTANEHAAKQGVARLLSDPRILQRAEKYFALIGLDEVNAQIKHAKLLHGSDEKIALGALKLYYDLKGKIVQKTESTHIHHLASLHAEAEKKIVDTGAKIIDGEVIISSEEERQKHLAALQKPEKKA